ncbi:MAG: hypothetical protein WC784_06255 [Candidatus Shapirobacteria bacterium]|jgi:hypothetical protein
MKDKHLPSIIGLIFLLLILFVGVYLSLRSTSLSSKANSSCEPVNPQVTNLTYFSFDFSFTTATSCLSTLSVNGKTYADSSTVSNTHYFKVSNLSSQTAYFFVLTSGGGTYAPQSFQVTTASQPLSPIPSSNLAWGKIIDANKNPVSGAIVYLTIPGAQSLSAFSNQNGNWNISFATSFNQDKNNWFSLPSNQDEDVIVYSPDGKLTQITNQTNNNDPVPDITIGQNYFSSSSTSSQSAANTASLGTGAGADTNSVSFTITSPAESETISTLKPDIFGSGPANTSFQLSLDGNTNSSNVANNGIWHWSPSQNLAVGSHKLVLIYQTKSITRNFSVSQNSSLAFTASSSASKITPTLIPTSITPTSVPTIKPTNLPTVVRAAKISTTSALYKTGDTFPTYLLVILASFLFSVSLYYYRK